MSDTRVKIQSIVENQLPDYISEESPLFVDFLKQYYISQEYPSGTSDLVNNLEKYVKLDEIFKSVVTEFKDMSEPSSITDAIPVLLNWDYFKTEPIQSFYEQYITFPLTTITEVKGDNAHELFKWAKTNHGKSAIPKWNFYKILINKEGKIEDTFSSLTNPTSNKIVSKIEKLLQI